MNTIDINISIDRSVKSNDWAKVASRRAKNAASLSGRNWIDCDVFVRLPEHGRCFTKAVGETAFTSHWVSV